MCGLFGGISSTLVQGEYDNIYDLGILSQFRGRDSTGVALAYKNWKTVDVDVLKNADVSSNFLYNDDVLKAIYKERPFGIIGHCRAATLGAVNDDNAHPFLLGHITGAHNGTISSLQYDKEKTDSEQLYTIMRDHGVQAAIDEAYGGAYALTWFDQEKNTLNLLRNLQRPLYMLVGTGCLYWASEYIFLSFLNNRQGLKHTIKEVPINQHIEIDLFDPLDKQKQTYVSPKTKTYVSAMRDDKKAAEDDRQWIPWEDKPETKPTTSTAVPVTHHKPKKKSKAVYKAFRNKHMDLDKAQRLLGEGCAHCTEKLKLHAATQDKTPHWYNHKSYLCGVCAVSSDARHVCNAKELFKGELVLTGDCDGNC